MPFPSDPHQESGVLRPALRLKPALPGESKGALPNPACSFSHIWRRVRTVGKRLSIMMPMGINTIVKKKT